MKSPKYDSNIILDKEDGLKFIQFSLTSDTNLKPVLHLFHCIQCYIFECLAVTDNLHPS